MHRGEIYRPRNILEQNRQALEGHHPWQERSWYDRVHEADAVHQRRGQESRSLCVFATMQYEVVHSVLSVEVHVPTDLGIDKQRGNAHKHGKPQRSLLPGHRHQQEADRCNDIEIAAID